MEACILLFQGPKTHTIPVGPLRPVNWHGPQTAAPGGPSFQNPQRRDLQTWLHQVLLDIEDRGACHAVPVQPAHNLEDLRRSPVIQLRI